jgi:hypothetical protein
MAVFAHESDQINHRFGSPMPKWGIYQLRSPLDGHEVVGVEKTRNEARAGERCHPQHTCTGSSAKKDPSTYPDIQQDQGDADKNSVHISKQTWLFLLEGLFKTPEVTVAVEECSYRHR